MPRIIREQFIWIPPNRTTRWGCTIDGVDIHDFILDGKFPRGLISEELVCEIELDNSGEDFTDRFTFGHEIVFKMDFNDGSTVQFKGEIEEIKKKLTGGQFILSIKGSHWTSRFLDITVNEEFTNATISSIRTSLISEYASGFTSTNVETNSEVISIKFINKPLLDCLIDLDNQGDDPGDDTYVDNDKDVHSFKRESKNNDNEALVWDDGLLELRGLGQDSAEVRNKLIVYGEAGGLPVIHVSEDLASQTTFRTKEKVITDTSITDEILAQATGDAETTQLKNPKDEGSADSLFMPSLNPGDMVYVIFPPNGVHGRFRLVKYVFKVPNETMEVFFNKERSIPKLFKERIKKDQDQETIVNPFNMTRSYTETFDNENNIESSSSGYLISEGKIRKNTSVESAIIILKAKTSSITAASCHLKAIGEVLDGATFSFRANNQSQFQNITANSISATAISNQGKQISPRIIITDNNTRIDSLGFYWKS